MLAPIYGYFALPGNCQIAPVERGECQFLEQEICPSIHLSRKVDATGVSGYDIAHQDAVESGTFVQKSVWAQLAMTVVGGD